jgi:hypothetical protein
MSWSEVRTRARQEVAKRSDLMMSRLGARLAPAFRSPSPDPSENFFFEPSELPAILDLLRQRLPDVVDHIIHQADEICRHRFDLLGYRGIEYGARIDWHLDAVHGKSAPRRSWFKVHYLDFAEVGDAKITWELNRHQHLVTLAKAYRLTSRASYAQELLEQWYDWQQQNPYPIGINWASSLEVALRSLSWLWIYHLLEGCSAVAARFPSDVRRALMLNGRHISRFLSTYFSPNTHLLGEAVGLFFIGTLCRGCSVAERWQEQGWQILLREAQRQVLSDGMHFEHSTYYHTYALDFFLHARVLAGRNGMAIPTAFDNTIERMLGVVWLLSKAGSLPRLGDDDGGRVFDPRRNRPEHMADPLALGAVLFNRGDFKTAIDDVCEETIWLSGVDGVRRFDELRSRRAEPASFALAPSGIYVMSSPKPAAQQLVIDAGPSEKSRNGHRHADALSLTLAVNGDSLLIDPGTFAYVEQGYERNRFRGTSSHNTVYIDGLSQAQPGGPFEWSGLRGADARRWVSGNSFDLFEGMHSGYRRLPDPVDHRRSIFYKKPHFWLVRDVLEGAGLHHVGMNWRFADGSLVAVPGGAAFQSNRQTTLGLLFASKAPWSREICSGWQSPVYGRREPAPFLCCTTQGRLPVEVATLLIPVSTSDANLGVFEPLTAKDTVTALRAYRYSVAGTIDSWFVFTTTPGGWRVGPWASDARFLFCAADCGDPPSCFVLCDGSYLAVNGRTILQAREPLKYAEFFADADRQRFYCANTSAVEIDPLTETCNEAISIFMA